VTRLRTSVLLFVALLLLAASLHPGVVDNVDSRLVLRTAERLVDARTWSLGDVAGTPLGSPEYGGRGPDGSYQMKFGAGNALLDVPFVVLGRAVLGPAGLDAARAGEAAVGFSSCLWFALSGVLVLRIARRVLPERGAAGAALLHCVASYALVYGRSAYLETPLTCAVLLAYDAALSCNERPGEARPAWVLGCAIAAVLWIKHAAVLVLAGVPAVLWIGTSSPQLVSRAVLTRASVPAVLGFAGWLGLNQVRFGSPFETGYSASARFDHPLAAGVLDLLFSERGGWLFFAPSALVGLAALPAFARRHAGLAVGAGLACVATIPLYARFFSPFGGDAWGPRYMVPNAALLATPAAWALSAALASSWWTRTLGSAVVAAGCALQCAPCVVGFPESWTAIRANSLEPRLGPVAARILREEVRGVGDYDLAGLGGAAATWSPPPAQRGADWWPVRVSREIPRLGTAAWGTWALAVFGAATAGVALALRLRRPGP
jgi:hypothetical protein